MARTQNASYKLQITNKTKIQRTNTQPKTKMTNDKYYNFCLLLLSLSGVSLLSSHCLSCGLLASLVVLSCRSLQSVAREDTNKRRESKEVEEDLHGKRVSKGNALRQTIVNHIYIAGKMSKSEEKRRRCPHFPKSFASFFSISNIYVMLGLWRR